MSDYFYVTGRIWSGAAYQYITIKYQMIDYITPPDTESCRSNFAYYENKGQVIGTNDTLAPQVKYVTINQFPAKYFLSNKIAYVYPKRDTTSSVPDTSIRIDMSFPNSLTTRPCQISPKVNAYLNYFLDTIIASQIYGYQRLLYPETYSNIDLMFYGNYAGEKFYFICDVGSRPTDIQLKYEGATSVSIVSGKLVITSKFGVITEATL